MKLGHTNDEIKYDNTYGTVARFVLLLDGEVTMAIQCDMADPEKVIKVLDPTGSHCLTTNGRFTLKTKLTEDADGMPTGAEQRVDRNGVYRYILPRMHVMLGRLLRAALAA